MIQNHLQPKKIAITTVPPWCTSAWNVLQSRRENHTVPHALLITGAPGLGKRQFADTLTHSLLCENIQKDARACNQCYSCEVRLAGAHPDFLLVTPEEEAKPIKIDQVRDLSHFAQQSVGISPYKVILLDPAEALNVYAANALLKTLEEPTKNTILILVSHDMSLLPATIKSRCQIIRISQPTTSDSVQWLTNMLDQPHSEEEIALSLSLAHGAPFQALEFLQSGELEFRKDLLEILKITSQNSVNIPSFASKWSKGNLERIITHWRSWISDIIYIQSDLDSSLLINQDMVPILKTIAKTAKPEKLYDFLETLNSSILPLKKGMNLNMQLSLESLMFEWTKIIHHR